MGENPEYGVGLWYYWHVIRRRWVTVAVWAAVGVMVALLALWALPTQYQATTQLIIPPMTAEGSAARNPGDLIDAEAERSRVRSDAVVTRVAAVMGLDGETASVRSATSAEMASGSTVMRINYTAGSPELAIRGAETVSLVYIQLREEIITDQVEERVGSISDEIAEMEEQDYSQEQLEALRNQRIEVQSADTRGGQVLVQASPENVIKQPRPLIVLSSGLALGIFAGLIAGFIRDRRDPRLHGDDQLSSIFKAPALGSFDRVETQIPLTPAVMTGLRHVREQLLARHARGRMILAHGDVDKGVPVDFAIGTALALAQSTPAVTLVIAGCNDRELVRLTRQMSLFQDRQRPGALRSPLVDGLTVITLPVDMDESQPDPVMTRAVQRAFDATASFTILALGTVADQASRLAAIRLADLAIVVHENATASKPDLERLSSQLEEFHTTCAGVVTVQEFEAPSEVFRKVHR